LIRRHRQCLLLHRRLPSYCSGFNAAIAGPGGLISLALIVNALNEFGRATLSIPFEYQAGALQELTVMSAASSPWCPDGITIGPIPEGNELLQYTKVSEVCAVAAELVLLEPLLVSHASVV